MPDLILKGKTPRQRKPGGWVAPESVAGGWKGVSTGIHSRCIRICMAQPSVISSLWPPTICWRLSIRCICAIYCDFLQGVDLAPTLFLLFLIVCYRYSVFRRRDGSRVAWNTSSGAKMWQIVLLSLFPASSACFYKIPCEYIYMWSILCTNRTFVNLGGQASHIRWPTTEYFQTRIFVS